MTTGARRMPRVLDFPGALTGREVAIFHIGPPVGDEGRWVGYGKPDFWPRHYIAVTEVYFDIDGEAWVNVADRDTYLEWQVAPTAGRPHNCPMARPMRARDVLTLPAD